MGSSFIEAWIGYIATSLVFFGVLGETVAEDLGFPRPRRARRCFKRISVIVLIVGLVGELWTVVVTDRMTAGLIAEAETARLEQEKLKAANLELERRQGPRMLDVRKFLDTLKGKPKASVEILYQPNDQEAYSFATQIYAWLGKVREDGAGWEVSLPKPIPPEGGDEREANADPATRYGAWFGLGILVNREEGEPFSKNLLEADSALGALTVGLMKAGFPPIVSRVTGLPIGSFIIVVGQKM